MSLAAIIIGAAAQVGAPLVKAILEKHVGGLPGTLAGTIVDEIATRAGVEPQQLPDVDQETLAKAVREVESAPPELWALWQRGLQGQFSLLEAETREGFWQSFWRSGWMYLLAVFWVWRIMLLPLIVALGLPIEPVEYTVLLTLTGWFMSLYMGGHTLKELGKNAIEAVRGWRRPA